MFKSAILIFTSLEIISLLAFLREGLSLPLLVIIGLITFIISFKNLEWGIYILFGELFVGSRGRLLEYDFISLRMVVFGAVFLAWLVRSARDFFSKNNSPSPRFRSGEAGSPPLILRGGWGELFSVYWVLLGVIISGAIYGYFTGNGLRNVFLDVNGYLYLAILPAVLAGIKTREAVNNLFKILAAAIMVIAAKTLLLFIWFGYGLPGVATLYHWIITRDIGEITGIVGSASRIFMQSQFWALVGVFIFLFKTNNPPQSPLTLRGEDRRGEPPLRVRGGKGELRDMLIIAAALLSVILSLSRSFWLGAIAGAIFLAGVWLLKLRWGVGKLAKLGGVIILIAALEIGGLYLISSGSKGVSESVASRGLNPAAEAAGSARLMLLPELLGEIKESPVIGKGFGEEVIYKSYLPDRITADNPEGEITSFAFEWGYLDIMLKIGLLGLLVYLLLIARIFKQGWSKFQIPNSKFQTLGLLSGLVALLALNITTPYLNHPLGIGYLILAYLSFQFHNSPLSSLTFPPEADPRLTDGQAPWAEK